MRPGSLSYLSLTALLLCSCVENLLPDPVYVAEFKSLTADGAKSVKIDAETSTVTIDMDEAEDLSKVLITSCHYNNDTLVKPSLVLVGNRHDLSEPLSVKLKTYSQDYPWKIKATQTIERVFTVRGQVGATTIDEVNHRVMLKVSKSTPRTWLTVLNCKLGPRDITTYSPDPLAIRDFSTPREIEVRYRGEVECWTVLVEQSQLAVDIRQISPRVHCCHIQVEAPEGAANGIVLRKKGDNLWKKLDSLKFDAGCLVGYADSLEALTSYECRAFTGSDTTDVKEFATGKEVQLPNGDLEESKECGNFYEFYNPTSSKPECTTLWWGSGNGSVNGVAGSADMGFVICAPDQEFKVSGKQSARLQSAWAIVKFAAGNLFCGQFAGLVGTSGGMVNFGRPFTSRPRALKVMVRYLNGPIDYVNSYPEDDPVKIGDPDKAQIFIALGDWDPKTYGGTAESPVQVNTTKKSTFFNPKGAAVIAYGTYKSDEKISEWREITIPLEYRDDFREPTHIIISCAASYLGDYFTGYSGSKLWVDDFELVY